MDKKPIVYACSGCSNLALMANDIALNMNRDGIAEMSCISGVIGKVAPIMKIAESGRPIIAIDGCSLSCTKACIDASGLELALHIDLSSFGLEKRSNQDSAFNESLVALKMTYDMLDKAGFSIQAKEEE
ncbi:putative zinc-binding protein [Aliikangiella sp. G2MR2-5]|uniref:putative zinc-binding protein n=1 Tax=Aliikangiella sp. G2MR2-5 TaxID=2788943 RepID=UPI0018A9DEB5